jgi:quercetin dioxygenase-like cupin family protein
MILRPTRSEELSRHNVRKINRGEGPITQIGNVRLAWKARGHDTGFQFGIFESTLAPQTGVPLHKHPFAEWFYVLEGTLMFGRVTENEHEDWISCETGDSVLAPANAPHGVINQSSAPARFLSVSNFQHEQILTEGGRFVEASDPIPTTPDMADYARFEQVANDLQGFNIVLDKK